MSEIDKLRKEIDKIDLELLKAINKRSQIAIKIGKTKKSKNLFRPNRQSDIFEKIFSSKFNKLNPKIIFSFWRSLFFLQIKLQGGINAIILKGVEDKIIKDIHDYFTHDIKVRLFKTLKSIESKINSSEDTILVLPYPSNKKNGDWWAKYSFDKSYIIASLPFIIEKRKKPNSVIISKHHPELKKGNNFYYLSKYRIKDNRLSLEAKANKYYFYKTNHIIKDLGIKFVGASAKRYEIKK